MHKFANNYNLKSQFTAKLHFFAITIFCYSKKYYNFATNGFEKYYIQSAYRLDSEEKKEQELKSLKNIDDSFKKIVIVSDDIATYTDEDGITYMGLFNFLLNGI